MSSTVESKGTFFTAGKFCMNIGLELRWYHFCSDIDKQWYIRSSSYLSVYICRYTYTLQCLYSPFLLPFTILFFSFKLYPLLHINYTITNDLAPFLPSSPFLSYLLIIFQLCQNTWLLCILCIFFYPHFHIGFYFWGLQWNISNCHHRVFCQNFPSFLLIWWSSSFSRTSDVRPQLEKCKERKYKPSILHLVELFFKLRKGS